MCWAFSSFRKWVSLMLGADAVATGMISSLKISHRLLIIVDTNRFPAVMVAMVVLEMSLDVVSPEAECSFYLVRVTLYGEGFSLERLNAGIGEIDLVPFFPALLSSASQPSSLADSSNHYHQQ